MPETGPPRVTGTEEDSDQEGDHPSDVLIVQKAVERKRKLNIDSLESVDEEAEADAKIAAKKARKAIKRANKAAAATEQISELETTSNASKSPSNAENATNSESGSLSGSKKRKSASQPATTLQSATAEATRRAKTKEASLLLSPENAPVRDRKRSVAVKGEASSPSGAEQSPVQPAVDKAALKVAFPSFETQATASDASTHEHMAPLSSNLPGGKTGKTNGGKTSSSRGTSLAALMLELQASPLQSPLPNLSASKRNTGPGSDSALAAVGVTPPPTQKASNKRSGNAGSGRGDVRSRLGGTPGSASRTTADGPRLKLVDEDSRPVANEAMQRLLRLPRYFDDDCDDFVDSAIQCFHCGGSGHKSFDCTNPAKPRPCLLCAEFGHTKANCPDLECFKCHQKGHISKDCPNGSVRVADDNSGVCLRCGSAACPGVADHVRARGGCVGQYSAADLSMVRCFVCCRLGHLCCQDAPTTFWRPTCHNCGDAGHVGSECSRPVPPAIRHEQNPQYRSNPQYTSEGLGAHHRDSGGYGGFNGIGGGGGACFSCGGFGHLARDCPSKQTWRGHGGGGGSGGGGGGGACFTCGSYDHIARMCPQKAYAPRNHGYNGARTPSVTVNHNAGGSRWGGTVPSWQSQRR